MDVTVIWSAIVALGVFMYVVLDGFGLGVGIVFPLFRDAHDRDLMMRTLAPIPGGNGSWHVPGGAALLATLFAVLFTLLPAGYAAVLHPLAVPLAAMLACLILRGIAFGIRAKEARTTALRDFAFIGGSAGAALFQGIALGAFMQGLPVAGGHPAAGAFAWLAPFPVLSGLVLIATYALLGSCWLVARTGGDLQRRLHRLVWPLTMALLAFVVLVTVWTPLKEAAVAGHWFDARFFWPLAPVPLLVIACAYWMHLAVRARHHDTPYLAALGLVALGYLGLLVSVWPYAIAQGVAQQAAASAATHSSPLFALAGASITLAYATMGYRFVRSNARDDDTRRYRL